MWKPAYTLTVGAVSMELFRTQEDYDTFNLKMSNIFGIDCMSLRLTDKDNTFQPENIIEPWNKGLKGQQTPWNKGLTKDKDPRISSKPLTEKMKKQISAKLMGHEVSKETRTKMSIAKKGKAPWNKGKNINSENMIRVKVTNGTKIFNSLKEAAEYEGVTSGAIIGRIKRSKKWSYVKTN